MGFTSPTAHLPALLWVQQALMVDASIGFPPRISRFDAAIDFKFQQVIKISWIKLYCILIDICIWDIFIFTNLEYWQLQYDKWGDLNVGLRHLGPDREGIGQRGLLWHLQGRSQLWGSLHQGEKVDIYFPYVICLLYIFQQTSCWLFKCAGQYMSPSWQGCSWATKLLSGRLGHH